MADGFEPYHVPQQSRRDKLRVISLHSHPACAAVPIYHHHHHLISSDEQHNPTTTTTPATCSSNHLYMDPHSSSINLNPIPIQDISITTNNNNNNNNNPFLFNTQQGLRFLDQSNFHGGGGGEIGVYGRPETLSSSVVTHEPNTTCGQGLSLSLSSHHSQVQQQQQPASTLELNLQRYSTTKGSGGDDCFFLPPPSGSGSDELSRNPVVVVPLGPFTGYASVLKGSKFLQPAQQLLDEISDMGTGIYSEKLVADSDLHMDPQLESFSPAGNIVDDPKNCTVVGENRRKKSRLMSMLDEVYKRYKQYYQQMQAVVASFESVSGVRNAAPFANLALKAMSKHFGYLKNAITDQLQFITESHITREKDTVPIGGFEKPGMDVQSLRRIQNNIGFVDHHHHSHQPVWRPQRGLPERAVTVLRAWLFEHFLHPYPTDTDKLMLAKQTGLSRNQVSNWFINARVRLWKPMVEEIHMLETRQGQKSSHKEKEEMIAERQNNAVSVAISNSISTGKMATITQSHQRNEEIPSKRTRNHDLPLPPSSAGIPTGNEQRTMNLPYDQHHQQQSSRHTAYLNGGGAGGVSLTLGLHQNNGIGLSDPFPINAARRLGLESSSDGYVMAGIDAQNQQFRREIIGGGQLLHDFVG